MNLPLSTLLGIVLCGPAFAQNGPSSVLAGGISLHENAPGAFQDEMLLKRPQSTGHAELYTTRHTESVTDYTLQALFPDYHDVIEIDAHDSGNGMIPNLSVTAVDANAPDLAAIHSWLELVVSYDNDAVGLPGSLIEQRRSMTQGRNTPGADLIGYMFANSIGLDPQVTGHTFMEQRAEILGFNGNEDVDAFDFGIGVVTYAQETQRSTLFTCQTAYYFSLSPDCVAHVNNRAQSMSTTFALGGVSADPVTIYLILWDGNAWSDPAVAYTPEMLQLDPAAGDNVDALALDASRDNVIFSTQLRPDISQLRLLDYDPIANPPGAKVVDLGDGQGGLATHRLGSNDDSDDLDSACVVDPEAHMLASHMGAPVDLTGSAGGVPAAKGALGLSATRGFDAQDQERIFLQVSGFDKGNPSVDWVVFYSVLQDFQLGTTSFNVNGFIPLIALPRKAQATEVDASFLLPPNFFTNTLGFVAEAIDTKHKTVERSWVVGMRGQ